MIKQIALALFVITAAGALFLPPDGQSITYERQVDSLESVNLEQGESNVFQYSELDDESQEALSSAKSEGISVVDGRVILSEGTTYIVMEESVEVYSVTTHSGIKSVFGVLMIPFLVVAMILYGIDSKKEEEDGLNQPDLTRASEDSEWDFEVAGRNRD